MNIEDLQKAQELTVRLDNALQTQHEALADVKVALEKYRKFLLKQVKKYRKINE